MFQATTEFGVSIDDIENFRLDVLCAEIHLSAQSMVDQMKRAMYGGLDKVIDFHGNTLDNRGQPVTYDTFLDLYERMPPSFDVDGNLTKPTIVAGPDMAAKLRALQPTQEQLEREHRIDEAKRTEYLAKKRSRRLS